MTSTCRRLGIDAQLYLTQLITIMPVIKQSEHDLWPPDIWKQRLLPAPLSTEANSGPNSVGPVLR
jgi:hypothetical protein